MAKVSTLFHLEIVSSCVLVVKYGLLNSFLFNCCYAYAGNARKFGLVNDLD